MSNYERKACSRCGATTETEAAPICRPDQDQSGEWHCPGNVVEADAEGYLQDWSTAYIDKVNAWVDAQVKKEGLA